MMCSWVILLITRFGPRLISCQMSNFSSLSCRIGIISPHGPETLANLRSRRRERHGVARGCAAADCSAGAVATDHRPGSRAWHHAVRPGQPPAEAHERGRAAAVAFTRALRLRVVARRP